MQCLNSHPQPIAETISAVDAETGSERSVRFLQTVIYLTVWSALENTRFTGTDNEPIRKHWRRKQMRGILSTFDETIRISAKDSCLQWARLDPGRYGDQVVETHYVLWHKPAHGCHVEYTNHVADSFFSSQRDTFFDTRANPQAMLDLVNVVAFKLMKRPRPFLAQNIICSQYYLTVPWTKYVNSITRSFSWLRN